MRFPFIRFAAVAVLCLPSLALSQETSWMRTNTLANALNPNLSVIGDFTANTGPLSDPQSNRFSLREAEIGLQASVDPYARADFFVAFPEGEAVELEEGYVSLLSLPLGLRARGGKFRANFGKMNMIHTHELPQTDAPLVVARFLGAEGLNDTGLEVSKVFAPAGLFTELSYGILNGLGAEEEADPVTTQIVDVNGNVSTVTVRPETPARQRKGRDFAHVGRVRFFGDLSDSMSLELGLSGLLHEPKEGRKQTKMGGADLTFRWKPLQEGAYRSFIWRTEGIYSHRKLPNRFDTLTGALSAAEFETHRRGLYSYVEIQPARRWWFGVRGDYVEAPETMNVTVTFPNGTTRTFERDITRAVTPFVRFRLSEFQRFRVQYQYRNVSNTTEDEHRAFAQWTVVLGPHGAHPF